MKLLDRKKINTDASIQKKLLVDEGVRIAKKVDVLRETLASLEKQHSDFLAGIRQNLINATKDLEAKKSSVEGEIRHLEERRKELLKPLDDKWATYNEKKAELDKAWDEYKTLEENLYERESQIKKTEKDISKAESKITELKVDTQRNADKATADRREAKQIKKEAEAYRDTHIKDITKQTKELTKREQELDRQRAYLELIKGNLEQKEKELEDKEKTIQDKYETLMRTIKRLKK